MRKKKCSLHCQFPCHAIAPSISVIAIVQVTMNQLMLAPVTLVAVFAWNMAWMGQVGEGRLTAKVQKDLVPSMVNGEP